MKQQSEYVYLPVSYQGNVAFAWVWFGAPWWPTVNRKKVKVRCRRLSLYRRLEIQSLTQLNWVRDLTSKIRVMESFKFKGEECTAWKKQIDNIMLI